MSTSSFVEQLYTRILGRESDAAGQAYWIQAIDSGAASAAEVARAFLDSAEFARTVAPVALLSYVVSGDIPEAGLLSLLVSLHQDGASLAMLSRSMVNMTQFKSIYDGLNDAAFLDQLYHNVFDRAPDAPGKAFWLASMASGYTRAEVVLDFATSAELQQMKLADVGVLVAYSALVQHEPTQAQIDAALLANDMLGLLNGLLSSAEWSGEDVPGMPPTNPVPPINPPPPVTPPPPTTPEPPVTPELPVTPEPPVPPEPPVNPPPQPLNATIASAEFNHASGVLTFIGSSFDNLGAAIGADIKAQIDWSKLVWDINGDNDATANRSFGAGDVVAAVITSATQLTVTLNGSAAALVASAGFGAVGGIDTLDVEGGFLSAIILTDAASDAPIAYSDSGAPTVLAFSSTKPDGAYGAGATIVIEAAMNEAVAAGATLTVTLNTGATVNLTAGTAGTTLTGTYTVGAGEGSAALAVASFTAGTVRDAVGNLLSQTTLPAGASANIDGASSIVIDTGAPTLSASAPADDATAVSVDANLVLTFSESVAAVANKSIHIHAASDDALIASIAADSALVTIVGNVVTINAAAPLASLTAYYVQLDVGAFADAAGNAYGGISDTATLQFVTGADSFSAVVVGSSMQFGGTATGDIVMTTDGAGLTFTRGGVSAPVLAIADIGAGCIGPVLMDSATFGTAGVASLLQDGAATIDAAGATAPDLVAMVAGADKIANGGISNAHLNDTSFAALAAKLAVGGALSVDASGASGGELTAMLNNVAAMANGAISNAALTGTQFAALSGKLAVGGASALDAGGASSWELSAMTTNLAKLADGAVSNAALSAGQFALLSAKLAVAGAASVDASGASPGELAALLASLTKMADGAIGNATLSHDQFATLSTKLGANGAVALDASGAGAGDIAALVAGTANIADGAISNAVLTLAQFTSLLAKLAPLGAAALDVSGATAGDITALAVNLAKVADGAISNATPTPAQFSLLADKLADGGALTVDASGASSAELSALAGSISKIADGGLSGVTLTAGQSAADIAALLSKTSGTVVIATAMDDAQLTALASGIGAVAVNGISGSVTLNANALGQSEMNALLSPAMLVSATVHVNAAGISDGELTAVVASIGQVDSITNLALTSASGSGDIATLLAKATDATVNVSGMTDAQLLAVGPTNVVAGGVAGSVTGMTPADLLALHSLASHITDGALTGDLSVDNGQFAEFSNLQLKLSAAATVAISGVADNATATVTNFVNASFTGTIAGTSGNFDISAGAGVQAITTDAGNDVIAGGAGDDVIVIGAGNDIVVLGDVVSAGIDSVTGFGVADALKFVDVTAYIASSITDPGSATLDQVVALAVAEAQAAGGGSSVGYAVGFVYTGSTYVYIDGNNDGYNINDDALVRLVGTAVNDLSDASFVAVI